MKAFICASILPTGKIPGGLFSELKNAWEVKFMFPLYLARFALTGSVQQTHCRIIVCEWHYRPLHHRNQFYIFYLDILSNTFRMGMVIVICDNGKLYRKWLFLFSRGVFVGAKVLASFSAYIQV